MDRAVSGAVAAVRSCVPDAQPRDRQSAAGRARMSGITLLHLHSAGRGGAAGICQCPVQLAVAAARRKGAAVYERQLYCNTNTLADLRHSSQLCLNSRPFRFRTAAAASPTGTLLVNVHIRFILS